VNEDYYFWLLETFYEELEYQQSTESEELEESTNSDY
jgi:hypothetical protein